MVPDAQTTTIPDQERAKADRTPHRTIAGTEFRERKALPDLGRPRAVSGADVIIMCRPFALSGLARRMVQSAAKLSYQCFRSGYGQDGVRARGSFKSCYAAECQ